MWSRSPWRRRSGPARPAGARRSAAWPPPCPRTSPRPWRRSAYGGSGRADGASSRGGPPVFEVLLLLVVAVDVHDHVDGPGAAAEERRGAHRAVTVRREQHEGVV